jgi:hypothetical protein
VKRHGVVPVLLLSLTACHTMAMTDDLPARISPATEASRADLQDAVNRALGTEVLLAADALTTESVLTIERNVPGGIDRQPAQGRNMDAPIQFRLVLHADDCILIDGRDESRYVLANTRCVAE